MEMEWWMRDVALFAVCYLFSLFCFPTSSSFRSCSRSPHAMHDTRTSRSLTHTTIVYM